MQTNRCNIRSVMEKLDCLLRNFNPIAKSYLQKHQLVNQNLPINVKMNVIEHYDYVNAPASWTHVSAIFVKDDSEYPVNRHICFNQTEDSF